MDTYEVQFDAFSNVFDILGIAGLVFLFALVSETLWDVITGTRKKLGETVANSAIAIVSALLERTTFGLVFVIGLILITPFAFEIQQSWWSWALALIAADFTYYWLHRLQHEVRIFWANHIVHHSSPEYNFTTALRIAWVDALIDWIFFIPMILAGFGLVQTVISYLVVLTYPSWIHKEKVGKLGLLDRIFNTPSVHRVHHGSNPQYIDKNYGGILILWDRLFGTYEPEVEKVIYGVTEPINSINPLVINFREYLFIFRDVRQAKSIGEACGYLFRGPGWEPEGEREAGAGVIPDKG
ncbi:MAG: sterol desaturase family protein, partial [Rhizobiaceae bacterium]|nr:sterol desaturase family protein [Rhizobiaceae bacterium]